jgi:hypothetical protein
MAQNSVVTTEKMLIENNEKLGLEPNEEDGNYTKLLESDRENPIGDKNYEKLLADVRVEASEDKSILEAVLNNAKNTINKLRDESTNIPLMDFAKKNVIEREKEYQKAVDKGDRDTSFWDKYVGQQLDKDQITKITNNIQSSQLISNYDTRDDFNKENPSIGKKVPVAVDELKSADAMLYFIYRTASEESRELSDKEKQMVTDINSGKMRILSQYNSQFKPEQNLSEEEWEELMREEQMLMDADSEEGQAKMRGEIAEANLPDMLHDQKMEDGLEFGDQFAQQSVIPDRVPQDTESANPAEMTEEDDNTSRYPMPGEEDSHPDTPSLDQPWWEWSR